MAVNSREPMPRRLCPQQDGVRVGVQLAELQELAGGRDGDPAGGFGEDSFGAGQQSDALHDLVVGDVGQCAFGPPDGVEHVGAVGWVADRQRAGDGDVLTSHRMQANQQVTFLTDGGEDIRELPRYLNPDSEHLLGWFHITMRITVMTQLATGLRAPPELPPNVVEQLQRLKWFLWHGNVFRALQTVPDLEIDLDVEEPSVS